LTAGLERTVRFDCFGGTAAVLAGGPGVDAVQFAVARLRDVHNALSRFLPDSELSRLNRDPRPVVPSSPLMLRFAAAVRDAGEMTEGLVDATLVDAIERAGYATSLVGREPLPLRRVLDSAPDRWSAGADAAARWRLIDTDPAAGTLTRPPGLRLDSGGLGKGLAADLAAKLLVGQASFAVDCAGDLRIGGTSGRPRAVEVADPFGGPPIHQFQVADGAVATSGIGRRSWLGADERPAHHLLDPGTGLPAYTGVVQATALAPTALEAEIRAKAAILSGPYAGGDWLVNGGVLILDDGAVQVAPGEAGVLAST
jgi:thiamine biosynthesis lipoprotein